MKNFYNISKGQLITIWIFGGIGFVVAALESYYSDFATFLLVFIPAVLVFYTIGWLNFNKKKIRINLRFKKENNDYTYFSKRTKVIIMSILILVIGFFVYNSYLSPVNTTPQQLQDDKGEIIVLDFNNPINIVSESGSEFLIEAPKVFDLGGKVDNDFGYTAYSYDDTAGKFVAVEFNVIFNGKINAEVFRLMGSAVRDQKERRYSPTRIESCAPTKNYSVLEDKLVILKPGIPCEFRMLFEVAPDSESLQVAIEYSTHLLNYKSR